MTEAAIVHERLSVHSVAFSGAPLAEFDAHWQALGVRRLTLLDSQLFEPGLSQIIDSRGPRIEQEGRFDAVRRACTAVAAMLHRLGT